MAAPRFLQYLGCPRTAVCWRRSLDARAELGAGRDTTVGGVESRAQKLIGDCTVVRGSCRGLFSTILSSFEDAS